MELKGRLKLIANKVPLCSVASDIGTDHAYIPIYLVGNNICRKAIAADIRKGPILIAQENIKQSGLEEFIETRLGNGLEPVREDEADVIIIAGMGGMLIQEILENGISKARRSNALVLQPMNAIEVVRKWLYDNGFDIVDEELIDEGEKIYNVIVAKWTGFKKKQQEIYYYIGEKLVSKKDPLLERYITKKVRQLENVIYELRNSSDKNSEVREKYVWLRDKMLEILETIKD